MGSYKQKQRPMMPIIALAVVIASVLIVVWIVMNRPSGNNERTQGEDSEVTQDKSGPPKTDFLPGAVVKQISKPAVIDYNELAKKSITKDLMEYRKKDLGVNDSVDLIVKSNESFTVGGNTVSMENVIEQAFAGKGRVFEKELDESGAQKPRGLTTYGVYVVQSGDNIWNIHFRMLKDYYARKGIRLGETADEPKSSGMSSGVGRILKFSEAMVIIYNLKEKKVTADINIIEPLSKVVIYNMDEIFALLEQIDFNNVDRLRFDGSNIWIPVH
ncbi:hypothetical protein [Desulfobacter postgatei]|uniref:hypothetical protein n=1 Tax=Desulfobacter postgatei TaxID=2293 RepID=UPI002A35EC70|nr:hypothetical protein [Desulfobacter postgatei]MDX9965066.1 hypothetical protein [Desulfobacter postgatei]